MHPDLICMSAPVEITAAETDDNGKPKGPPKFEVVAYTGGKMMLGGWDLPVVVDLDGMSFGKSLVANLDHDSTKRVGNVTSKAIKDGQLVLGGVASAATDARREVIESAAQTFVWQASIEATPDVVTEVAADKTININGQEHTGPLYVAAKSTLKGFAFVSHGADDNTSVNIAATADHHKEKNVDTKLIAFIKEIGLDPENVTDAQIDSIRANFDGKPSPKPVKSTSSNPFEARKLEAQRREEIRAFCDRQLESRQSSSEEINAIEKMHDHAIESGMTPQEFRNEYYEACVPVGPIIRGNAVREKQMTNKIVEAAICQAGRLPDIEKHYDDRTLQAAHDEFKGRIGLKQVLALAAESNNQRVGYSASVHELLAGAFGNGRQIHASGFSTLEISNIVSNTANKFIMRGWNAVDRASLEIASVRPVTDFKTITTVSLTENAQFEKVGSDGEIKHRSLGDLTYTNKADTYAGMLAITRQDIINDDLGALSDAPMKLGMGAMDKLNDIFWTEFLGLVGASFFASGNSNINTGVATMTEAGIDATYVIFKNQTKPNSGTPLGLEPRLIVVPTALEGAAQRQTVSMQYQTGATTLEGSTNIWAGRFNIVSSPYISNSSYTGYTSVGWWMLADPSIMSVIEIVALNGRVEPTVDTADADFHQLGIQMRGYSDVGVSDKEYRGGVYADGGSS